jgi:hypothetical protein
MQQGAAVQQGAAMPQGEKYSQVPQARPCPREGYSRRLEITQENFGSSMAFLSPLAELGRTEQREDKAPPQCS